MWKFEGGKSKMEKERKRKFSFFSVDNFGVCDVSSSREGKKYPWLTHNGNYDVCSNSRDLRKNWRWKFFAQWKENSSTRKKKKREKKEFVSILSSSKRRKKCVRKRRGKDIELSHYGILNCILRQLRKSHLLWILLKYHEVN